MEIMQHDLQVGSHPRRSAICPVQSVTPTYKTSKGKTKQLVIDVCKTMTTLTNGVN